MTFGINITNDDGYLTFSDTNDYYQYEETLSSGDATLFSGVGFRFYWTTTYSGSAFPLVFIYSNGYWASIVDTFRNANGTWQIHVLTDYNAATATKNNIEGYVFVDSSQAGSSPAYGIKINNSSGDRVYDSNFNLINVKDFATVPACSSSYPSCSQTSSGVYNQTSAAHGVSGLTKPAAILYSNGGATRSCTVYIPGWGNVSGCNFSKTVHKITSTTIYTGWAFVSQGGIGCNNNVYNPTAFTTPIIDGNDY